MILQFDAALAGCSLAIVAVKATARPATRDAARKAFGMLVTSPRSFGWPALRGFNVACRSTGLGTLSNRDVRCHSGLGEVTASDLAGCTAPARLMATEDRWLIMLGKSLVRSSAMDARAGDRAVLECVRALAFAPAPARRGLSCCREPRTDRRFGSVAEATRDEVEGRWRSRTR